MTRLLSSLLAATEAPPFAVIHREHESTLDVLVGDVVDVDRLADIPLGDAEVLALVPFRQVRERGFAAHDDDAPIRCLVVQERESVAVDDAVRLLPRHPVVVDDLDVDVTDEEYAAIVRRVIDDEIGRGEGANFVIRREFTGSTAAAPATAVLGWLRALLEHESGAYWTFALCTPGLAAVGATPERHVSSIDGVVSMNPISGTFRHGDAGRDDDAFLAFLDDVQGAGGARDGRRRGAEDDERGVPGRRSHPGPVPEADVAAHAHRVPPRGAVGRSTCARCCASTMFAPTVTGSPMGNACAVIARHERRRAAYYAGVLARFTPRRRAGVDLDAPILIRTAYLDGAGRVRVPVGATLVRHSDPAGEVAETRAKAAGVLTALGALAADGARPVAASTRTALDTLLDARNDHLAAFWRSPQAARPSRQASAIVIDAGDDFTTMLAHQLRHLGVDARVVPWHEAPDEASEDLVVFGPGPGDPRDPGDPRVARLRELIATRLASGRPMLAVCLSHQVLADLAGLPIAPLPTPRQGVQLEVDVFGERAAIGFYNTFAALAPSGSETPLLGLEVAADATTGVVHALRGSGVASVQGHLESVTSPDGLATLERLLDDVLAGQTRFPAVAGTAHAGG